MWWQAFIPNFHYLLTDLSRTPEYMILEKQESEYLRNLFLALKLARDSALVKRSRKKIFTFDVPLGTDNYAQILS